jgi:hypothetical protein
MMLTWGVHHRTKKYTPLFLVAASAKVVAVGVSVQGIVNKQLLDLFVIEEVHTTTVLFYNYVSISARKQLHLIKRAHPEN